MDINLVIVVGGFLLIISGIAGGGLEAKGLTIPKFSVVPRLVAGMIGIALVLVGVGLSLATDNPTPPPTPDLSGPPPPTPTSVVVPTTQPTEDTSDDAWDCAVTFSATEGSGFFTITVRDASTGNSISQRAMNICARIVNLVNPGWRASFADSTAGDIVCERTFGSITLRVWDVMPDESSRNACQDLFGMYVSA